MLIKDIASFGAVLLCALLIGCSDPGDTDKMAEQVADGYYQALKNKDFEKASQFFMETPGRQHGHEVVSLHRCSLI